MRRGLASAIAVAWLLADVPASGAQTTPARGFVALTAGINVERAEDDLSGTSAGGGAIAGLNIDDAWAIEGEVWYPGAIRTRSRDGGHRDILAGASIRRSFGRGRARPHLLAGLTVGRTQDEFTTCTAIRPAFGSNMPVAALVSCADPDVVDRRIERSASVSFLPLLGAGVEIEVGRRWRLIPAVRLQVWPASVIVRPAIAVGLAF
jgi:hypothetical protein